MESAYYAPHQKIIREDSTRTKLIIVFYASSHEKNAR